MPMSPYPLACHTPGCGKPAIYKIAARWSDGITGELKTYSLCCADCLPAAFRRSREKQAACRLAPGESLAPPGIYRLERGSRDIQLQRLADLEQQLSAS
jgi:hypothetical protein